MEESLCSYCGHPNHSGNETICDRLKYEYGLPLKDDDGIIHQDADILPLSERIDLNNQINTLKQKLCLSEVDFAEMVNQRDEVRRRNAVLRTEKSVMKSMCDKAGLYRTEMNDYRRILEEILPTTLVGTKTNAKITKVLQKYSISE